MLQVDPSYALAGLRMTALGSLIVPDYKERLCWYHKSIAEACEGLIRYVRYRGKRGGYARVGISMPPRHGKSLHGRELLPALALGQDPNLKIIATSRGTELAKEGLSHVRQWMSHPEYKKTFATRFGTEMEIDERGRERRVQSTDKATLFRTLTPRDPRNPRRSGYKQAHGYYLAQGMDASLTGWGYDIGIIDDLIKNDQDAMSDSFHARMWSFYTSTFATRGESPYAVQLYIGTRWTEPDFADGLLEFWEEELDGQKELIKILRFPALAEDPIDEGDPRQPGEGLDTVHKSTNFYVRQKRALIKMGQGWVWDGLWQQRPNMTGVKLFQDKSWLTYGESFDLDKLWYVDFSVDPNLSERGQSFAVISVFGVMLVDAKAGEDAGEHYFALDEARGHWGPTEFENELEYIYTKWERAIGHAVARGSMWVENKALGPALISKFGHRYPIVAVPKMTSKLTCYRLASTVTNRKRVRVPVGSWGRDPNAPLRPLITDEWVGSMNIKGSWIHELASHPSKPDDRRDALAQQIICRDRTLGMHLLNIRG